jgi:hypothetical protein
MPGRARDRPLRQSGLLRNGGLAIQEVDHSPQADRPRPQAERLPKSQPRDGPGAIDDPDVRVRKEMEAADSEKTCQMVRLPDISLRRSGASRPYDYDGSAFSTGELCVKSIRPVASNTTTTSSRVADLRSMAIHTAERF